MEGIKKIDIEDNIYIDKRGWVINPFEQASIPHEKVGNLHVVSLHPHAVRGNHYHPDTREWLLVFDGPTLVSGRLNSEFTVDTILVEENKPTLIEIPPGAEHAIKNISHRINYFLSFSDSEERETIQCPDLFGTNDEIEIEFNSK